MILSSIQLVTSLSVLIGIGLVVYELRQAKQLAIAEVYNSGYISLIELSAGVGGENIAETIARIQANDPTISDADLYRFDAFAQSQISSWRRAKGLTDMGFYDESIDWTKSVNEYTVCWYFNSDVGRRWLKGPFNGPPDEVMSRVLSLIESCTGKQSYLDFMRGKPNEADSKNDT